MVYSHRYPSSLWNNDDITWCNHDRLFMDSISERKSSMRSHSTTIFLWFSHGFPMVFLWGYIMPPRKTRPRLHDLPRPRRCKMRRPRAVAVASKPFWPMAWRVKEGRAKTWGKTWGKRAENGGTLKSLGTWGVFWETWRMSSEKRWKMVIRARNRIFWRNFQLLYHSEVDLEVGQQGELGEILLFCLLF